MKIKTPRTVKSPYLTVVRDSNDKVLFSYRLNSTRQTLINRIKRKGLSGEFVAEYYLEGVSVNKVVLNVPACEV